MNRVHGGTTREWLCCGAAVVLLTFLTGCGGSAGLQPITGRVTLDGEPVVDAKVEFFPLDEGDSASARTDSDGRYELIFAGDLKGAPAGKYDVWISKVKDSPRGDVETLPAVYNEETQLSVEVAADGGNQFNFDLKRDG